jgi:putative ABC transport system permease protein
VLGVIGALTARVLERRREIGVLRGIGALSAQVRRMVLVEAGLIGFAGAALGCVAGFALALLLIEVINRMYFGWTIRLHVDP